MEQDGLSIVAISGSLRSKSFNTALLRTAQGLLPAGVTMNILAIDHLPLYNADLEEGSPPEVVTALKQSISDADGVLIATPEYNYGIPGPLKNAIDWASRPGYRSPFANKPVAIIGASPSTVGTARAQGQLKQVLLGMISQVFPFPEVAVNMAAGRFDDNGQLTDARTREQLETMLQQFVAWVRKVR
jgi:chromate reductase